MPAPRPKPTAGPAAPAADQAAAPALRIGLAGIGPLRVGMPIDRDELAHLVSGYTVVVSQDEFEGETYEVYEVREGEVTAIRVVPSRGTIGALTVFSSAIPSDTGVAVGTDYATARDRLGPLACELTYHEDMFPEQPTCTAQRAPSCNFIFEDVEMPGLEEGAAIPDAHQEKLLGRAKIEAIDFHAPR